MEFVTGPQPPGAQALGAGAKVGARFACAGAPRPGDDEQPIGDPPDEDWGDDPDDDDDEDDGDDDFDDE